MTAPFFKLIAYAKREKTLMVMVQNRGKKSYIPYGLPQKPTISTFQKMKFPCKIKKINKYPITCLPSKNRKNEPPDSDYHDPRFLTHFFDLDFLRSPRKSVKNEDYANANPDFF